MLSTIYAYFTVACLFVVVVFVAWWVVYFVVAIPMEIWANLPAWREDIRNIIKFAKGE